MEDKVAKYIKSSINALFYMTNMKKYDCIMFCIAKF